MIEADYLKEEPSCRVIGPQIGPIFEPCGVRITIALPHKIEVQRLTCRIYADKVEAGSSTCTVIEQRWGNYRFDILNLTPGTRYTYAFFLPDGAPLDLEGGLSSQDCHFFGLEFSDEDSFVLLSCNNPFYSGKVGDARFAMWSRLLERVSADPHIKLLIQGGDQVYHDDIETPCFNRLSSTPPDNQFVIAQIIRNYQHFYGHLTYRKVLASIPSVAMLDDHDITDGWGGRSELFGADRNLLPAWSEYLRHTYGAFLAYQTLKNPDPIAAGVATTFLDFGLNRLYLLDMRREKNINRPDEALMTQAQLQSLLSSIETTPANLAKLFVLSPVVPARVDPGIEESLMAATQMLYGLRTYAAKRRLSVESKRWLWTTLHWIAGRFGAAYLTDDISDSLSSVVNRKTLLSLLGALFGVARDKGIAPYFLSGDIHAGGISEIVVSENEHKVRIPQIVSSPIGYTPMERFVRGETTEEGDFEIAIKPPAPVPVAGQSPAPAIDVPAAPAAKPTLRVIVRNIFYRSDRNFCVVTPGGRDDLPTAEFHFERVAEPIFCPTSFVR